MLQSIPALLAVCTAAESPHIVVLVADDQGWAEPGCYGGGRPWATPAIDALAASGLRCTQAYAAGPVCSPTRASLLTGRHPARLHLTNWIPGQGNSQARRLHEPADWTTQLPATTTTVAGALRDVGYATCMVGKWHVGEASPTGFGFDQVLALNQNGAPRWWRWDGPEPISLAAHAPGAVWMDEVKVRLALRWLGQQRGSGKPCFVYIGCNSIHGPIDAAPALRERYAATSSPAYAGMQTHLDAAVGTMLDGLRDLGLEANTAVIYLSDNGVSPLAGPGNDSRPLRGIKAQTYEGGIRIPWIMRVPGRTRPGTTSAALISTCDLFPTLLDLAGRPLQPHDHCDGISLAPFLDGRDTPTQRALGWHYPHITATGPAWRGMMGAWRAGDLKLVADYESGSDALYDIAADPGETQDLAAARPDDLARLRADFLAWKRAIGAQEPLPQARPGTGQQ
jgi:arylsulfatase A-like enzyme